jgi:uracil phosphoribosyltransferase
VHAFRIVVIELQSDSFESSAFIFKAVRITQLSFEVVVEGLLETVLPWRTWRTGAHDYLQAGTDGPVALAQVLRAAVIVQDGRAGVPADRVHERSRDEIGVVTGAK